MSLPTNSADSAWVITKAAELGFDLCGLVPAEDCLGPAHRAEWLARGFAGQMRYLHDARRDHVLAAMPEARTAIVCALNYNTAPPYSTEAAAQAAAQARPSVWLSRYAWGDDYHQVILEKLQNLIAAMRQKFPQPFSARAWVDTGPLSERVLAQKAGLGWLAKNTCLINRELGSWLFLGVILTSLGLTAGDASAAGKHALHPRSAFLPPAQTAPPADSLPPADLCGNCSLCIDACPTGALVQPYVMDARRCISYLTIELRGPIPESFRQPAGWQVFGCDICQDVCPWNRGAPLSRETRFAPRQNLLAPDLEWLLSLQEDDFRRIFKNSAVRRAKWRGLIRNACVAAGNILRSRHLDCQVRARLREKLAALAASADALISAHARWALAQSQENPSPPVLA